MHRQHEHERKTCREAPGPCSARTPHRSAPHAASRPSRPAQPPSARCFALYRVGVGPRPVRPRFNVNLTLRRRASSIEGCTDRTVYDRYPAPTRTGHGHHVHVLLQIFTHRLILLAAVIGAAPTPSPVATCVWANKPNILSPKRRPACLPAAAAVQHTRVNTTRTNLRSPDPLAYLLPVVM